MSLKKRGTTGSASIHPTGNHRQKRVYVCLAFIEKDQKYHLSSPAVSFLPLAFLLGGVDSRASPEWVPERLDVLASWERFGGMATETEGPLWNHLKPLGPMGRLVVAGYLFFFVMICIDVGSSCFDSNLFDFDIATWRSDVVFRPPSAALSEALQVSALQTRSEVDQTPGGAPTYSAESAPWERTLGFFIAWVSFLWRMFCC